MSLDIDAIEEEAKGRRRDSHYDYQFNWPELASADPDLASSIARLLENASHFLSLAARISDEQDEYTDINLIRDFLLRGTRALRSTLCLDVIGNYEDAWSTARVLVEHCVYLAYLLKTGEAKGFLEFGALEMKKWGYKAASLNRLSKEFVSAYDNDMEEALGHKLGRTKPEWSNPNIEEMCKANFGEQGSLIYSLYRMASARVHPGIGSGDGYLQEAMKAHGVSPPRGIALKAAIDAFQALIAISETRLIENRS